MGYEGSDHQQVTETVYRYATGIDTRDFALYRSIFADELQIDFSSYNGRPGGPMSGDDWAAGVQPLFYGLNATQHSMSNPIVTIDGDTAHVTMYMQAEHVLDADGERWFAIGGYYDDDLVRTGEGWKITAVRLTVFWRRGDASIMPLAAERGAAYLAGRGAPELL